MLPYSYQEIKDVFHWLIMDQVRISNIEYQPKEMSGLQVITDERISLTISLLKESRPETIFECSGLDIYRINWDERRFSAMIQLSTFKKIRSHYLDSLT